MPPESRGEDEQRIAGGIDVRRRDAHDLVALMRVLHGMAQLSIEKRTVRPLMDFVYANLSGGADHIADSRIACARGCAHCCTTWVEASAPEVFYAVAAMSPEQRADYTTAVEAACARTGGLSYEEREKGSTTPCPILRDNVCSLYEGRPLTCRTAVSTDADLCHRAYRLFSGEDIPAPPFWHPLRQAYSVALQGALLRAGVPHGFHEWNESLRVALTEPNGETRWLGGADLFAHVPRVNAPATFTRPNWRLLYAEAFGEPPP
jgi:putative zinc- or iron-chelating protein